MPKSPLKRVKLDISSWYMHNVEAYNLLSKALTNSYLSERIENARHDEKANDKKRSQLREDNLQLSRKKIVDYLEKLDQKYEIENPLPKKGPRFINP